MATALANSELKCQLRVRPACCFLLWAAERKRGLSSASMHCCPDEGCCPLRHVLVATKRRLPHSAELCVPPPTTVQPLAKTHPCTRTPKLPPAAVAIPITTASASAASLRSHGGGAAHVHGGGEGLCAAHTLACESSTRRERAQRTEGREGAGELEGRRAGEQERRGDGAAGARVNASRALHASASAAFTVALPLSATSRP